MGFNSPSLNPENEQVQYLQKIALRAENPAAPSVFYYLDTVYFLHEVQFSAPLRQHIFRQIFEMQPCLHSKKGPHSWGRP
jgi:hypothetical protein